MMHQHRPSYEVRIFLHLNLSYELIKHVKRNSCLCHFEAKDICTNNVNKCVVTDTLLPMVLRR